jgi:hypothetical protein
MAHCVCSSILLPRGERSSCLGHRRLLSKEGEKVDDGSRGRGGAGSPSPPRRAVD